MLVLHQCATLSNISFNIDFIYFMTGVLTLKYVPQRAIELERGNSCRETGHQGVDVTEGDSGSFIG